MRHHADGATCREIIEECVPAGAALYTDGLSGYVAVGKERAARLWVGFTGACSTASASGPEMMTGTGFVRCIATDVKGWGQDYEHSCAASAG